MSASTRLAALFAACLVLILSHVSVADAQSMPARSFAGGRSDASDPSDTRLVLMPTARTLPSGASSLTFLDVLFPLAQFGVSDRLSIGAGTVAVPVPAHPIIVLAKLRIHDDGKTRAAAGVINATGVDAASIGFAYGVVTRGTDDDAWTAGAGWMYARADGGGGGIPVAFFGGEHRLSASRKAIVDVLVRQDSAVANAGIRVIRGRMATDFAAMVMMFEGGPLTAATISVGWRF